MGINNGHLQDQIKDISSQVQAITSQVKKIIVGQDNLIRNLLLALFARGHVILEGVPGLAKTLTIDTLSKTLEMSFKRIQFTPDLLPSDLIGTQIYNLQTNTFSTKKGPIFANFILADEINRAPAKVQSALLEAMAERQVTIGDYTHKLEEPFIVLATQNPLEQEGTYALPEAQLDRFIFKTIVKYPNPQEEIEIMKRISTFQKIEIHKIITQQRILEIQQISTQIIMDQKILEYIRDIIFATRSPANYGFQNISEYIMFGGSPRSSLALVVASKVLAMISGRDFVIPEDIKEIAYDILRHRILLTYEALAQDISTDEIISTILKGVQIK